LAQLFRGAVGGVLLQMKDSSPKLTFASINRPSTIAANIPMIANGERVSGAASEDGVGVNLWDRSFTVIIGLSALPQAHPDHSAL
jgi:hypothetical protein